MGLAGSWTAGAVFVDGDEPARFDQVTTGRAAIFTAGRPVRLPDHHDGWRWEPYAVDGTDIEAARQQLQRLMRDAEADICGRCARRCSNATAKAGRRDRRRGTHRARQVGGRQSTASGGD